MKKIILTAGALVCLGGLIGCQNQMKEETTNIEELENKIKEQENYITELECEIANLEYYREQEEHTKQQAQRTQQSYDEEQKRLNEEKYYIALTDVYIISKTNSDSTIYDDIQYGENRHFTVLSDGISELGDRVPFDYRIEMAFKYIKSGETFKLSGNDINNYQIFGDYEEIKINIED